MEQAAKMFYSMHGIFSGNQTIGQKKVIFLPSQIKTLYLGAFEKVQTKYCIIVQSTGIGSI